MTKKEVDVAMKNVQIVLTENKGKENGVRYRFLADTLGRFFMTAACGEERATAPIDCSLEGALDIYLKAAKNGVSPCHLADVVADLLFEQKNH